MKYRQYIRRRVGKYKVCTTISLIYQHMTTYWTAIYFGHLPAERLVVFEHVSYLYSYTLPVLYGLTGGY